MRSLPILLSLALAGGCVKKSTHQKALDQIKSLEGQLAESQKESHGRGDQITTLEDEIRKLEEQIAGLSSGKTMTEEELAKMREQLGATETELAQLREQRDAAEKRLAAYRDLQKRFKSLVDSGALEIAFRNGQMTLKLPSGVLFASGAAELSKAGKETIASVTEALMAFKDRRFLVAGHTDNVPIKTKQFRDNWYLSTSRAVSVLEFMISSGFPADKLAAAGYADKDPVGDNATDDGKEQNRRIEIILVPDLSELPQLTDEPE